jgi:hypothetical protein
MEFNGLHIKDALGIGGKIRIGFSKQSVLYCTYARISLEETRSWMNRTELISGMERKQKVCTGRRWVGSAIFIISITTA